MNKSWQERLDLELAKQALVGTKKMSINPSLDNVFRAFTFFEMEDTRVVIMGQNPYRKDNIGRKCATGLAFGLPDNLHETDAHSIIRDSLFNDYSDIKVDDMDYTLEHWAEQGVLLLNAALTVGNSGPLYQHVAKWRPFMENVIEELDKQDGIIFCFLGTEAGYFSRFVRNNYKITVCNPEITAKADGDKGLPESLNFRKSGLFTRIDSITSVLSKKMIKWI